jgi:hypothetical protein
MQLTVLSITNIVNEKKILGDAIPIINNKLTKINSFLFYGFKKSASFVRLRSLTNASPMNSFLSSAFIQQLLRRKGGLYYMPPINREVVLQFH